MPADVDTTTPNRSDTAARLVACRAAAETGVPSMPGSARVAVAPATTVGACPRPNAPRAVELMHMWVMKPTSTRLLPGASRSFRSVPVAHRDPLLPGRGHPVSVRNTSSWAPRRSVHDGRDPMWALAETTDDVELTQRLLRALPTPVRLDR